MLILLTAVASFDRSWHRLARCSARNHHRRVASPTMEEPLHQPYSWDEIILHAANQSDRVNAGEYPGRSPEGNRVYEVYKQWCKERGLSNADYVLKYVQWQGLQEGQEAARWYADLHS